MAIRNETKLVMADNSKALECSLGICRKPEDRFKWTYYVGCVTCMKDFTIEIPIDKDKIRCYRCKGNNLWVIDWQNKKSWRTNE